MKTYYISIENAVWSFPIAALLFTLPYCAYCYRKFGSISFLRTVIMFSMLFYLECAYFLIVFPLPDAKDVAMLTTPAYDLIPFHFIHGLALSEFNLLQPSTWIPALKSSAFLEPFFNLCLIMPFGAYLAYYFKKKRRAAIMLSFALSLFFELTQLSALYGIYPRPYRLFSVDDLILNTLGGLVGYCLFAKLGKFLPSRDKIDEKSLKKGESSTVSHTRRLTAAGIDFIVVFAFDLVLLRFTSIGYMITFLISLNLLTAVCSLATRGFTAGKWLVRIKVESVGRKGFAWRVLLRYLLRNALVFMPFALSALVLRVQYPIWVFSVFAAVFAIVFIDFVLSFKKGRRLWYERLSGTANASVKKNFNYYLSHQ